MEIVVHEHYFESVGGHWVCECGQWRDRYGHDLTTPVLEA